MRLLHSQHLTFCSFVEYESIPTYAVLSHTWGEDEVTYKEMNKRPNGVAMKKGYQKIKACAQQALKDGIDYFWVDTCCIDKSSSSELSEAINSMFHWYRNAHICYAYLFDVPTPVADTNNRLWTKKFQSARWFARGWTLQELIAPKSLEFYSSDWSPLGTKVDLALAITERTTIPYEVIISGDFSKASLAQRMSWAAGRLSSRREDAAYCLMGIFDVNMPMLYGEGDRAFLRLQEEIIRRSDDLSIFSWVSPKATFSTYRGLLAREISDFAQCNDIRWVRGTNNDPYQTTNKGIRISLPLIAREGRSEEHIALLRGVYKKPNMKIGIFLQKIGEEQYARIESDQLAMPQVRPSGDTGSLVRFFVRQSIIMEAACHTRVAGISLSFDTSMLELLSIQPLTHWNEDMKFFSFEGPIQSRKPPTVIFELRPLGTVGSGITISVNAENHWGSALEIDKGWNVSPALTPFVHKFHCRKPQHPVMEVLVERGVFEGEAKIILSVMVFRHETV